jgi:SH3-like domain-containing protein
MLFRALALMLVAGAGSAAPALAETARPRANPLLVQTSAPIPRPAPSPDATAPKAVTDLIGPPTLAAIDPGAARRAAEPPRDPNRGAVTNLPLPRFVSLKSGEGNARRGPGLTHRIDWVFTRTSMPLKITAEHEHWRRIEDAEGMGGWVHFALLSGVRTALVAAPRAAFHSRPDTAAQVVFAAEAGVVGKILQCAAGWCRLVVDGQKGWVPIAALWGVDPDETIE